MATRIVNVDPRKLSAEQWAELNYVDYIEVHADGAVTREFRQQHGNTVADRMEAYVAAVRVVQSTLPECMQEDFDGADECAPMRTR